MSPSPTTDSPQGTSRLSARALTLAYEDRTVVHELDLAVPDGQVTVIVGPNACGKSTTLRALGRLLKPRGGAVLLDGTELARIPTKRIAQSIGLLPQTPVAPEAITVSDLVARGRQPHQSWWQQWSDADERAVTGAMARTDVTALAERPVDELSGGQRQRVWIAMALAQETDLLLLDEPTTYLDIAHQVEVLDLVRQLASPAADGSRGRTVVTVLHDLNQAARYADHLVAMKEGRIVAEGRPEDVVTAGLVREVFGLEAVVVPDPVTGSPLVVPGAPWSPPPGPGPAAPAAASAVSSPASASASASVSDSASASAAASASDPTPGKAL
ncbi:ATP-binding cassette domain-containing protein [Streptomyces sp. SID8356]|uniref:ABC transporter ATP-binding protein n=1 Tax=unclassified Streptomyces TaxID=2593676 RepID=UPI00036DFEE5|nr:MULTISPECIES: ABC transporter ATP-binding protein [unclassified Streptomyces]MYT40031.1 ATP-binding cassette domain-containing protein [Streptomyces sp. SID8356]